MNHSQRGLVLLNGVRSASSLKSLVGARENSSKLSFQCQLFLGNTRRDHYGIFALHGRFVLCNKHETAEKKQRQKGTYSAHRWLAFPVGHKRDGIRVEGIPNDIFTSLHASILAALIMVDGNRPLQCAGISRHEAEDERALRKLCRHSSEIRTGCADQRPSGSVPLVSPPRSQIPSTSERAGTVLESRPRSRPTSPECMKARSLCRSPRFALEQRAIPCPCRRAHHQ